MPRTAAALTALCSVSRPGPGIVRASSVFPILSTILLLLGGLCIGAGRFYSRKNNIVLSAGILFVAAGEPPAPFRRHRARARGVRGAGGADARSLLVIDFKGPGARGLARARAWGAAAQRARSLLPGAANTFWN